MAYIYIEKERERERRTNRQTDRKTDKQTETETETETDLLLNIFDLSVMFLQDLALALQIF